MENINTNNPAFRQFNVLEGLVKSSFAQKEYHTQEENEADVSPLSDFDAQDPEVNRDLRESKNY